MGAKGVLLADTLSRLITPGRDQAIPGLNVSIASVIKIRQTRLAIVQEETKNNQTLTQLGKLLINCWPEGMQDLPDILQPYWWSRDELAIQDGLVMKGSIIFVSSSLRSETLERRHAGP